ncbi:MAG: hypothetical protein ABW182_08185 [Sphingomonas sp.]
MDDSQEAVSQLIVAGGDGASDLQTTENALDAIALVLKLPVIVDLTGRFDLSPERIFEPTLAIRGNSI